MLGEAVSSGLTKRKFAFDLIDVCSEFSDWGKLDSADVIIFGSPTYFGGVTAHFKTFLDKTGPIWAEQRWSGKIAGAFTVSDWPSGDKLQTLIQISLFAAQHGMHWATPGSIPPKPGVPDGCNRLGGWLGVMAQAVGTKDRPELDEMDLRAGEQLGIRAADLGRRTSGRGGGAQW